MTLGFCTKQDINVDKREQHKTKLKHTDMWKINNLETR